MRPASHSWSSVALPGCEPGLRAEAEITSSEGPLVTMMVRATVPSRPAAMAESAEALTPLLSPPSSGALRRATDTIFRQGVRNHDCQCQNSRGEGQDREVTGVRTDCRARGRRFV